MSRKATDTPHPSRSPKAGRPLIELPTMKRRGRRASGAVRKDTMILQAAQGPRVLWGRTQPKIKKG